MRALTVTPATADTLTVADIPEPSAPVACSGTASLSTGATPTRKVVPANDLVDLGSH